MRNVSILVGSHLVAGVSGFAVGIYTLPFLTAGAEASDEDVRAVGTAARLTGEFKRDLPGSDPLHSA